MCLWGGGEGGKEARLTVGELHNPCLDLKEDGSLLSDPVTNTWKVCIDKGVDNGGPERLKPPLIFDRDV